MNYIKDIKLKEDSYYNVVIEIPMHTNSKYELDEETFSKLIEVRKVHGKYPFYYGCFPQTYAGDGDALDMILFSHKKRKKLDIVKVIPVGVIKTIDWGCIDDKVLVLPIDEEFKNLDKYINKALKFIHTYKGKDNNTTVDDTIYDSVEAMRLIDKAHKAYANKENIETNVLQSF